VSAVRSRRYFVTFHESARHGSPREIAGRTLAGSITKRCGTLTIRQELNYSGREIGWSPDVRQSPARAVAKDPRNGPRMSPSYDRHSSHHRLSDAVAEALLETCVHIHVNIRHRGSKVLPVEATQEAHPV
jgi:hypothetical protein